MKLKSDKVNEYSNLRLAVERADEVVTYYRAIMLSHTTGRMLFKTQMIQAWSDYDATEKAFREFLLNDDNFEKEG